ncbi:unnamed protein product [Hydatigera taeniaeformis]|uniref:Rab-GAP TBC domain-containing protein n=1 Tax=Hydatigena taeniaeformis TaxID=6205 RepID=A0A0R3X6Q1_HYDTA|nr:unnamed protein product [Hydatigera taeniaeformis]
MFNKRISCIIATVMSDAEQYIEIRRINHLLPYSDQIEAYAEAATIGLRESFRRLISSSTYLCHHHNFTFDIKNFIEMFGFRFTKREFIGIVRFGLALVFCRQTDRTFRAVWADCIQFLLTNAGVFITRDELQLDWRLFRNAAIDIGMTNDVRQCKLDFKNGKPIVGILNSAKSRVWLDDIFHIWYKYPKPEISKEVISLLSCLALGCPGRIDWEPHLDRIFNFLMLIFSPEKVLGDYGETVALDIADILVFSIVPGSSTIDRLRDFFEVGQTLPS